MNYEGAAVAEIEKQISKSDYLVAYISQNDKRLSWDGTIDVYKSPTSNNQHKKSDWIGSVPIQVKGKSSEFFPDDEISFSVETSDLQNYLKCHGTILFVVYINHECQAMTYYKRLLPYDLALILKDIKEQKTKSIRLTKFPTNKDDISNTIIEFVKDMDLQKNVCETPLSLEALESKFGVPLSLSIGFSSLGHQRDYFDYISKKELYLYATHPEINISFPVQRIDGLNVIQQNEGCVRVGGVPFYPRYRVLHSKDGNRILIGKSFSIGIENGNITIDYRLAGNLDEQIIAEKMMIALLENENLSIGDCTIPLSFEKQEKTFEIENAKSHVEYMKRVQKLLIHLGCTTPLDVDRLDKKAEDYLYMLVEAFDENKRISFGEKANIPLFSSVYIGNLRLLLVFNKGKDGLYTLKNYFKEKVPIIAESESGKRFETSQYIFLDKECFLTVSNLDLDKVIEGVKEYSNPLHCFRVNALGLELLKAYDESNNFAFLRAAKGLFLWLEEAFKEQYEMYRINYLQCVYREGQLSEEEKEWLEELIKNEAGLLQIGALILLDESAEAIKRINLLPAEDRDAFNAFPITALLNRNARGGSCMS